MDEPPLDMEEPPFLSPGSLSTFDDYAANPRFIELQEELRCVLFAGVASRPPSRPATPEPAPAPAPPAKTRFDFGRVSIPPARLVGYFQNWIVECAPYLDKFDAERHFGIHVPLMAAASPPLFYAVLAFSARQAERRARLDRGHDSLELYQESIRLLAPGLQARDPNMLVTACILAVLELMSGSPRDWRRHIEGCAALFDFFAVTGFSGGLLQAVFWCYARMELCGAVIAAGAASTVLPLAKWTPPLPDGVAASTDAADDFVRGVFYRHGRDAPGMHANWAVYLCARACDLLYRRTRHLELQEADEQDTRPFVEQWRRLWDDLQFWLEARPGAMLPVKMPSVKTLPVKMLPLDVPLDVPLADAPASPGHVFPTILFAHWAAISANQMHHAACILMLEMRPAGAPPLPAPQGSAVWHARRVCGISSTNPHRGNLINAIQPLYLAGRLLSHRSEHLEVARLFKIIDRTTGWGALWRLRDLEAEWGYKSGEILSAI